MMTTSISEHDPVVLTGCGWVTPFQMGAIKDVLSQAQVAVPAPPAIAPYWPAPDQRVDDHPGLFNEIRMDKGTSMAAIAIEHACREALLSLESLDPTRSGLTLGIGLAGQLGMIGFSGEVRQKSARFVSPIHFPQTVGNYIAGALARGYHLRGPNVTLACGDASGLDAMIEACSLIESGRADVMLAGGMEQWSDALATGLADTNHVLSEGACLFVVERASQAAARGVEPLARVAHWKTVPLGVADFQEQSSDEDHRAGSIQSTAGFRIPGGLFIESWSGRCPGAGGAAAAAAAIGAVRHQQPVPVVDGSDPARICISPVNIDDHVTKTNSVSVAVLAEAHDTHRSVLALTCPLNQS